LCIMKTKAVPLKVLRRFALGQLKSSSLTQSGRQFLHIAGVNAYSTQVLYPQPYQGFSSASTRNPSINLLKPLIKSTTAISSSTASSSNPDFCTAEVWTPSQYSQPSAAETTAIISFVKRSSFPGSIITALTLFQFASK